MPRTGSMGGHGLARPARLRYSQPARIAGQPVGVTSSQELHSGAVGGDDITPSVVRVVEPLQGRWAEHYFAGAEVGDEKEQFAQVVGVQRGLGQVQVNPARVLGIAQVLRKRLPVRGRRHCCGECIVPIDGARGARE